MFGQVGIPLPFRLPEKAVKQLVGHLLHLADLIHFPAAAIPDHPRVPGKIVADSVPVGIPEPVGIAGVVQGIPFRLRGLFPPFWGWRGRLPAGGFRRRLWDGGFPPAALGRVLAGALDGVLQRPLPVGLAVAHAAIPLLPHQAGGPEQPVHGGPVPVGVKGQGVAKGLVGAGLGAVPPLPAAPI